MEESYTHFTTDIKQEGPEEVMDAQHHSLMFDKCVKYEYDDIKTEPVDKDNKDATFNLKTLMKLEMLKEEPINDAINLNLSGYNSATFVNSDAKNVQQFEQMGEQPHTEQIETNQLSMVNYNASGMYLCSHYRSQWSFLFSLVYMCQSL